MSPSPIPQLAPLYRPISLFVIMATDNCDMLLLAAELLEHKKTPPAPAITFCAELLPKDNDMAVPDIIHTPAGASTPLSDDCDESQDDSSEALSMEGEGRKRFRLSSLKVSRLLARDSFAHNSVEKRRRAYLASCYDNLKCSIPALSGTRASNVKVLRAAVTLIKVKNEGHKI